MSFIDSHLSASLVLNLIVLSVWLNQSKTILINSCFSRICYLILIKSIGATSIWFVCATAMLPSGWIRKLIIFRKLIDFKQTKIYIILLLFFCGFVYSSNHFRPQGGVIRFEFIVLLKDFLLWWILCNYLSQLFFFWIDYCFFLLFFFHSFIFLTDL